MAAPATHIVLAEKVFNRIFEGRNEKLFMMGTSFPDIRYLGAVDRGRTHFDVSKIGDLDNLPDFIAGMKFHSLVDMVREKYVKDNGLYSLFPESKFLTQCVKMLEDKILMTKFDDWDRVARYFDEVIIEEREFGIRVEDIEKWHGFLKALFFSRNASDASVYEFAEMIGRPREMAEEMVRVMNGATNQLRVNQIIENFYDDFEEFI